MMTAALAFIRATVPWQAWAAAGAFAAFGLWHWYSVTQAYKAGRDNAIAEIRTANDQAKKEADNVERAVKNCFGVWDRAHGVCLSHSPR